MKLVQQHDSQIEASRPLTLLHVSPSFAPAWSYGGPIESSYQLCRHLAGAGCRVDVLTTDADGLDRVLDVDKQRSVEMAPGLNVRYCTRVFRHSVSPTLLRLLVPHIRAADVVHLHAVYSFPTIPTLLACRLLHKPLVWSTRGALRRWDKTRRRSAKWLWERACRAIAPKQTVFHVTSEMEARDTEARMGPAAATALIPNGVPIPERVTHTPSNGRLRLLFLGRIDPQKALDNLLGACEILAQKQFPYSLVIAGPVDRPGPYFDSLRARMQAPALAPCVKPIGQVGREALSSLFADADVLILPSHAESFGIAIAEALAHGVPAIAGTGTPWSRLEEVGCGLWVDNAAHSLANAIEKIGKMPLRQMGERGRQWMLEEYSWQEVTRQMHGLYVSLAERQSGLMPASSLESGTATTEIGSLRAQ